MCAPCYVSSRQIHEDLGVPLFADHARALTASFDSKLADVGNPLVRKLGRNLRWPRVVPVAWHKRQGRQGPAGQSRPSPVMAMSTKRIMFGTSQPSVLRIPWLRFFCDVSSVVRQMPRYKMQSQGMVRTSLLLAQRLHLSAWQNLHTSTLWLSQSGLRTQTANQPKFISPIICSVPPRH